ncbi:MAG: RsmB/NOP family class I SAM-dependent RNA methyltransferase [Opitutaceae bacterium]|nr:RsmB/NOP family class I SAM-dependent RNA methyltransferase [Opitutaceae bacterium]
MKMHPEERRLEAWPAAVRLLARWLDRHERVDELLESLPRGLSGVERARCQHLVFGAVRHHGRLDAALRRLVPHAPRFPTRAVLLVAGVELLEGAAGPAEDGLVAKIVHHAVEQAKALTSPAEARLVNAVVRKLAPVLAAPPPPKLATAEVLAEYYSHPEWLVRRWLLAFGAEATRKLLEWNQQPAHVYARWRNLSGAVPPAWLKASAWPGFFEVEPGHWPEVEPLLRNGDLYLQDPATRLAVELLAPQRGETVLDLCAAPGGKSLLIADALASGGAGSESAGRVVAFDLPPVAAEGAAARPSPRIERLKENLSRVRGADVALVLGDVQRGAAMLLREHNLPEAFPAVLIDVPCSNTGVMRHRVDVKWRLQDTDIAKHGRQQLALLHAAARLVAPGGRLVYSTCSLEPEENDQVVRAFFDSRAGGPFKLERSVQSFPWITGHDGAGAFLLRRQA